MVYRKKTLGMGLGEKLQQKLKNKLEPSARIDTTFGGKDLTIITDSGGNPQTLFIGMRNEDGSVKGEMYVRRSKIANGTLKIHWDNKGKVTR